MKKIVTYLTLIMVLFLSGCYSTEISITSTTSPQIPKQPGTQGISQTSNSPGLIRSFEEYSALIPVLKDTFPDFLCYDAIESCGKFIGFGFTARSDSIPAYQYKLHDKNGLRYSLCVFHEKPQDLDMGILEDGDNPNDLRFHKDSIGYYYIGGIEYAYYEGKLYNIKWQLDQRTIMIQAGSDYIHTSPLDGDTFISRLLNKETAEAAVAEFNAKVAQARAEKAD